MSILFFSSVLCYDGKDKKFFEQGGNDGKEMFRFYIKNDSCGYNAY